MIERKRSFQRVHNPLELAWRNLKIEANVSVEVEQNGKKKKVTQSRMILKGIDGVARSGHFTAILGPSGSGKTTLLNFLSGRLVSNNLEISGEILLNGQIIPNIDDYNDQIAYVMQDDILLLSFTPRETFSFTASLRLSHKTQEERDSIVENMIRQLNLEKCSNTIIGGDFKRGISGGERKRTSIGVELLTEPKILFLDEPTTGLDSSTAKQVIAKLKDLCEMGVNIVSTIHQPSSEIVNLFDNLLLLVEGQIIYQGPSKAAIPYFSKLGLECPISYNPSDYFMKLMSEEGLMTDRMDLEEDFLNADENAMKSEFKQRVAMLVSSYQEQEGKLSLAEGGIQKGESSSQASLIKQFGLLFLRGAILQVRSKYGILLRTAQTIAFIISFVIVFNNLGTGAQGIQTRRGACFFMASSQGFAAMTGSLASFSIERKLFLRERANKSYRVGPYFWGKTLSELPSQIFFPILFVSVSYYWVGFNNSSISKFFIANFVSFLTYWYASAIGVLISVLIPQFEVAVAIVPLLLIPFMVCSGFFIQVSDMPIYWRIVSYLSVYRYSYEALFINEIKGGQLFYSYTGEEIVPITSHTYETSLTVDCIILFALGAFIRVIALFGLSMISSSKRTRIQKKKVSN